MALEWRRRGVMSYRRSVLLCCLWLLCLWGSSEAFAAEEYSFDLSGYEKRPYEFNGYAELRWEQLRFNTDAALYKINFFDQPARETLNRSNAAVQLEGRYRKGNLTFYARVLPSAYSDALNSDSQFDTHELNAMWQVKPGLSLDAGKKLMKWGKGYAWNPVGFIERPKDPNEPDLGREGYVILGADLITTHSGPLQTIAFTPVLLPVYDNVNEDYSETNGETNHLNLAGKLYLLYNDTDIDLLFLAKGSRTARVGADFSRNISTNFEVHGEWAFINDDPQQFINSSGVLDTRTRDARRWLLGMRYLTETETTYILEYYRNDAGFSEDETKWFYQRVDAAYMAGDTSALKQLRSVAKNIYAAPTMMQDYLYLRAMQKDPFDILYVTPALTLIYNLDDRSYNASPELVYTGISNLELRAKLNFLHGGRLTEFGEKQNDSRLELRVRYFF